MNRSCAMVVLLCAAGCGHKDAVTFVTSTDVGIDVDAKTQNLSVGFSRIEGVVGPVYESGAIPPVFARIKSNAKVFSPEISQLYATGDAAVIASGQSTPSNNGKELDGNRKTMFFGTATNLGVKAGFTGGQPRSLNIGYKRQEFSRIPIIDNEDEDVYGSVLAAIELGVAATEFKEAGVRVSQLFASGQAAEALAPYYRTALIEETEKAASNVGSYANDENTQRLRQALEADNGDTFENQLRGWLAANGLDVPLGFFVESDRYPILKQRAVIQLLDEPDERQSQKLPLQGLRVQEFKPPVDEAPDKD